MKRIFLAFGLVALIGAGCLSKSQEPVEVVGDWHLVFDLPSGWVAAAPYDAPEDTIVTLQRDLSSDMNEVIVQSVDRPIVLSGDVSDVEDSVPADTYVTSDYIKISVLQLDARRKIPSEAEDLGSGLFRVKLCEDGGGCTTGGKWNYEWYVKTATASYRFTATSDGDDFSTVEQIIRGVQEATRVE